MAKKESEQFGRVLPITDRAKTVVYGVKIFPFKVEGGGLDFSQGILVWKRDIEDVLTGRIPSATVFIDEPLPSREAVAPQAKAIVGGKR